MKKRLFNKLKKQITLLQAKKDINGKREMSYYKNHDIAVKHGEYVIHCHKYNKTITNTIYVKNKVCPDCGKLETNGHSDGSYAAGIQANSELAEKEKVQIPLPPAPKTMIVCSIDNLVMEQTESGIFYCKNGHKKIVMDLVSAEVKEKIEAKESKRKRKIEERCPFCNKIAEVIDESKVFGKLRRKYSCGHTQISDLLATPVGRDEIWNRLYEFQQKGVEFVEDANYQAQIGDEMGLGKTIQALATLRYNYDQLTPCLMVCESSKVYDWKQEFKEWVSDKYNGVIDEPIIHDSGKYGLAPGFKNHIISMSLLQKPKVLKSILEYGFKFMVVDESHSFKNESAERTYALQQIAKEVPHKLFLSGTPIMNKVMEYFVPLNILRPSHFPSKDYLAQRCDRSPSGRILGLSDWYRPKFFSQISDYVIRRTKKDSGVKLPEIRMNKHYVNINTDKIFVKGYNDIVDDLEKILEKMDEQKSSTQELLGIFAKLRHITGIAKVKPVIQLVNEFLESTDPTDKITIGVHHKLVGEYFMKGLAEYNPITISDENPHVKMERIEQFKRPENRVLIASILGAGQGLNIQFCKNAIVAEREWNPSKEDQFCARFHRIVKNEDGSFKTDFVEGVDSVTCDFINAKDTIDDFFDALVELKKHIVGSTLDADFAYDPEILMDLARKITASRLKLHKDLAK